MLGPAWNGVSARLAEGAHVKLKSSVVQPEQSNSYSNRQDCALCFWLNKMNEWQTCYTYVPILLKKKDKFSG